MAYLKKTERHNEILKVAMQIIIVEGIASITSRSVAKEAGIAVGQIHNHFKSIGQLKALALIHVTDELIARAESSSPDESMIDKIVKIVSPVQGQEGLVIRKLWNEAFFLAERDPDIKRACVQSIESWHGILVKLLGEAVSAKQVSIANASEIAWRLIALSCGIDSLSVVDESLFSKEAINNQIYAILGIDSPQH